MPCYARILHRFRGLSRISRGRGCNGAQRRSEPAGYAVFVTLGPIAALMHMRHRRRSALFALGAVTVIGLTGCSAIADADPGTGSLGGAPATPVFDAAPALAKLDTLAVKGRARRPATRENSSARRGPTTPASRAATTAATPATTSSAATWST